MYNLGMYCAEFKYNPPSLRKKILHLSNFVLSTRDIGTSTIKIVQFWPESHTKTTQNHMRGQNWGFDGWGVKVRQKQESWEAKMDLVLQFLDIYEIFYIFRFTYW